MAMCEASWEVEYDLNIFQQEVEVTTVPSVDNKRRARRFLEILTIILRHCYCVVTRNVHMASKDVPRFTRVVVT